MQDKGSVGAAEMNAHATRLSEYTFDAANSRLVSPIFDRYPVPAPPPHLGACRSGRSGPHDGEV